jgi:hypothetical protein
MLQVVKMFQKKTRKSKIMVELICDNDTNEYYVVGTWFYDDGEQIFKSEQTEFYDEALTIYIDKVLEYTQLKQNQQTHYMWK